MPRWIRAENKEQEALLGRQLHPWQGRRGLKVFKQLQHKSESSVWNQEQE